MSLYKRRKIWHTDFSVNGQRFRQSLETTDWPEAQAKELIAQASEGKITPKAQAFCRLGFTSADRHLDDRTPHLAPKSVATEQERLKPLRAYLQRNAADPHHAGHAQNVPFGQAEKTHCNKTINLELGVVRSVLKRAKRTHLIADEIKPLPARCRVGRALRKEQKLTMRSCEVKALRWQDVDFIEKTMTVRKSKTDAGRRLIPLNEIAWGPITELFHRAEKINGREADHFVFPACENGKIDPTRPQKTWRSAWCSLTRTVQCPACGSLQRRSDSCSNDACKADIRKIKSAFSGLRFHDLRHYAITVIRLTWLCVLDPGFTPFLALN